MFTIKYYKFFNNEEHKIRKNNCIHWFFTILNLITNIIYCVIYNLFSMELFFVLFFPCIFCPTYYEIITYNWKYVYDFGVDECPITELTVRGRGYRYYYLFDKEKN